jgi:hypothetical protein
MSRITLQKRCILHSHSNYTIGLTVDMLVAKVHERNSLWKAVSVQTSVMPFDAERPKVCLTCFVSAHIIPTYPEIHMNRK